ncbi:MAG: protein-L-isoaspartate(D-aspartate) O-methyltransferase [Candidatus Omnitrophota bacterium]
MKINNKRIYATVLLILSITSIVLFPSNSFCQEDKFTLKRERMVTKQIQGRGITDQNVIEAMLKVKRHLFVTPIAKDQAYEDASLPIGYGQTISQPYIGAYMTEAAGVRPNDRVLEIGTGSGYQAAVLAEIVKEVYTIEIVEPLAAASRNRLDQLGYKNIFVKHGDGYQGWKEKAPFDAIIVTAAPEEMPEELIKQLRLGGRMVVPVGDFFQELWFVEKTLMGVKKTSLLPVRFVPMVHSGKR